MTYSELTALIDKVIGAKGIARVSSWWLKKLFRSLLDYAKSNAEAVSLSYSMNKRDKIKTASLVSSTQTLSSGYKYEGNVPFNTVDLYLSNSKDLREAYIRFILSESDDVSYDFQGDDELGGIIWVTKPKAQKNTEYAITVLGDTAWAAARPLNHIRIKYNITDISAPTKMFNKTGSVALFLLDGVKGTMSEEHQFDTTGIHVVDIYDTSIALAKVMNGISEIVDVKIWTYGSIAYDIESLFEGTSIRSANFTEYRHKNQYVTYGQTFENCPNLDERYLNADLRNMAFRVDGRMYNMFNGTTLKTIDLSTWDLTGNGGLGESEWIFPSTLKRLIVGKSSDICNNILKEVNYIIENGGEVIIASEREPYAVFYNPNGTVYKEMTLSELNSLPSVPELEGYTAVGWNLELSEIKERLSLYDHCEVGAVYSRADTIIVATIPEDHLVCGINLGTPDNEDFQASIEWGDGSDAEEITLTNGGVGTFKHQYASAGDYEIRITRESGYCDRIGIYAYTDIDATTHISAGRVTIVGDGFTFVTSDKDSAFPIVGQHETTVRYYFSASLSYLSVPPASSVKSAIMNGNADYDLLNIVLPQSVTIIMEDCFRKAKYLQCIIFPTGLTSIGARAFEFCFSMRKVVFPPALTTIGARAFADCFRCSVYDFSKVVQVPEIAADAFPPLTEDYEILVSAEMYDEFSRKYRTTHWASRIYKS
ncbi:MAG: leucine-rich repeat domain-containing protein [Bacteroidales bacterium]|nr:leucine-rich repeat domain-containing protein [Bacteroidales bacterium]